MAAPQQRSSREVAWFAIYGNLDLKVSFYNPILTSFQSSVIDDNRYHSDTKTLRHSMEVYEEVSFRVYLHPADRQPWEYTRAHSID